MKKSLLTLLLGLFVVLMYAQTPHQPDELTVEDYENAEYALRQHTQNMVLNDAVRPNWISNTAFWYSNRIKEGRGFTYVDAAKGVKEPLFDHKKLAKTLSRSLGIDLKPYGMPLSNIMFNADRSEIKFQVTGQMVTYFPQKNEITLGDIPSRLDRSYFISPDGKKAAYIKNHNLWLKDLESGAEKSLTTTGVEDYGFATNNAGWLRSERPVLIWSPDSKKIATFQHDARGVGDMHLVKTNVGHPELISWKYPLPEDSVIFRVQRCIIHIDEPKLVFLDMPADQHRSSITDHIALRDATLADAEWSEDSKLFAFLSNSRNHQEATLRVADPITGEVKDILEEKVETFFESGFGKINWHLLKESNEALWYSQRSNWGHLYLYDLKSGALKNQITSGDWNVLQVRRIDQAARKIYFTGSGREEGDPYFEYFYSIDFDGENLQLLTPDNGNHAITLSPDGSYFVAVNSTPDRAPVSVLRDKMGKKILDLEKADLSQLLEKGWKAPMPFSVKARDGETDLYGLIFKPKDFDPNKKYPIINYIYPGPQTGSIGSRAFQASRRDNQAIANLGFIVMAVDAMGTPKRSKSFHAAYYGNMGDNGLPDQVGAMKQLAERHSWIDLERAGIYGHSGGGFATAAAMFDYPDFFKVGVSAAGNHDNRNYEDDWGEKWQGLLGEFPDGTTTYDNQANHLKAHKLKGKLMLAHGTMDDNVPYYNTMLVVNSLIDANKDFDLVMMPNRRHGFGYEPFWMRKRWDYFVSNLLGATPPKEYQFKFAEVKP